MASLLTIGEVSEVVNVEAGATARCKDLVLPRPRALAGRVTDERAVLQIQAELRSGAASSTRGVEVTLDVGF